MCYQHPFIKRGHLATPQVKRTSGETILDKEEVKLYEHILSIIMVFFSHFTVDL